jgi:hypothetical protein
MLKARRFVALMLLGAFGVLVSLVDVNVGQTPAPPAVAVSLPIPAVLPSYHVKARDYGVTTNWGDATKNSSLLQTLVDTPVAETGTVKKRIHIEGITYVDWPPWNDHDDVEVVGESRARDGLISRAGGPVLVAGISRTPFGVSLGPEHFVDTTLPGSPFNPGGALNAQRKSYAIKFTGDTVFASPASTASHGPPGKWWESVSVLTIEGFCDFPADVLNTPFFGIAKKGDCRPFRVRKEWDGIGLRIQTNDGKTRECKGLCTLSGPTRFTVRIDLPNGKVSMWASDIQLAVRNDSMGADFVPGNTLKFINNDYYTFFIGCDAETSAEPTDAAQSAIDLKQNPSHGGYFTGTLFGLALWTADIYRDGMPGSKLTRVDGAAISADQWRYCMPQPGLLWCWSPVLDPVAMQTSPCITTYTSATGATMGGQAFLLQWTSAEATGSSSKGFRVADLALGNGGGTGAAILMGHVQDPVIERCNIGGGASPLWAIASFPIGWNYKWSLRDNVLSGGWGCLMADMAQLSAENTMFLRLGTGGTGALLVGCDASFINTSIRGNGSPKSCFKTLPNDSGGPFTCIHTTGDFENGLYPSDAFFDLSAMGASPGGFTTACIVNASGIIPSTAVGIKLRSNPSGPAGRRAVLKLMGSLLDNSASPASAIIQVDAANPWRIDSPNEGAMPWLVGTPGVVPTVLGPTTVTPVGVASP